MYKRALIESSISQRISFENNSIKSNTFSIKGINYFDIKKDLSFSEEYSNEQKIKYNNEDLFEFINEISKDEIIKTTLKYSHKTVTKELFCSNGSEKQQKIYYNEFDIVVSTKQEPEKSIHTCIGYTNKLITCEQMHELYELLLGRLYESGCYHSVDDGSYDIILSPEVASVFIHEIVGHMCEYDNPFNITNVISDKTFEGLTVIDDPTCPYLWGSYNFDDEGSAGKKTVLLKHGKFGEYMNNLVSAETLNTKPNGHARALSFKYKPIIRMSNTFLLPGNTSYEEMVSSMQHGIVALTSSGGMLKRNIFKLNVMNGLIIKNGKITGKIGPFCVWGKVGDALQRITAIGKSTFTCSGQGCYKQKQGPLPVSCSSPHIMIKNLLITQPRL